MKVISPVAVTAAMLTASTVAEADYAAWTVATTYALGARVINAHRVFESAVAGNKGHDPQAGDPSFWIDIGPTNRWAMFDSAAGPVTTAGNSIQVTLSPGAVIDALALIDLQAATVRVQVKNGAATLFDETRATPDARAATFLSLPPGPTIIVTAAYAGEQVVIGKLSIGKVIDLGESETTPSVGITDYSRRETDDFGVTTVVERAWSKKIAVKARLSSDQVDAVQRALAAMRAVPAVWIGEEGFECLTAYGFYKDFSIDLQLGATSFCSLTIEGLPTADLDVGGEDPAISPPSNLRVIDPMSILLGGFTSSTVAENDYPEWSGVTVYPTGARVIRAATHRVYESVADGNAGNDPVGSSQWLDVRATNRWAMFDQAVGSATTSAGQIVVGLTPYEAIAGVAVLDTDAASVRVQAPGYDRTIALAKGVTSATFLDLAVASGSAITVTVAPSVVGGAVSVGTVLLGPIKTLGQTETTPTIGITDYSRKDSDDFGNTTPVERAWAKKLTARSLVASTAVDTLLRRVAALRAKPALWIGDDGFESLIIYGFFRDFSVELSETTSLCSWTIEGLSKAAQLVDPTAEQLADLWRAVADAQETGAGALTAANAAGLLASGKTTIFYRNTAPTAAESQAGDEWVNTAAGNFSLVRVAGSGRLAIGGSAITIGGNYISLPWIEAPDQRIAQALTAAAGAQATADGKVTTFSQETPPTTADLGDLWYQPSTGSLKRWDGATWGEVSTVGATATQAAAIAASEAAIDAITSDDVLSRAEKPQFVREYNAAYARYSAIDAKAATFGNVGDKRAALTAAWNALSADVTAIAPAYDDTSADSPIIGDDLQTAWDAFYTAYAALDMAITAQTIAVQWSVDGETAWHDGYVEGDKWQRQSTDGGATWGEAVKAVGEDGGPGAAGLNNATVFLYQRAAAAPAVPSVDATYTFATKAIAGFNNGWSSSIPAGTQPLFVTAATASSAGPTDTIAPGEWAAPVIFVQNGAPGAAGDDGAPGLNAVSVYLYQRATAAPAAPAGPLTFTFATGALSGTLGAWSTSVPAGTGDVWRIQATALGTALTATDTIAAGEWSAPVILAANGQYTSFVFQRAADQPNAPTSAGTPPAGWSDAPPPAGDPVLPLWQSSATFKNGVRTSAGWSTPIKLIAASLADLDPAASDLLDEAMLIATGKATVFVQAGGPTAAQSQANDVWINTAAGNRTMVRVAGSGRLAIGGSAITIGGNYVTLPWIEAPDAQLGQALQSVADAIVKAQNAQNTADAATASIVSLGDDGQLTGPEKKQLILDDAKLDGAWSTLDAQAAGFGITTERTAASTARSAWQTYRNALSPAWNDVTRTTAVDRTTFRAKLTAYDGALQTLRAAIAAYAAKNAQYDLISGNKPPSNSDNTAANQHYLGDTPTVVILADYQGVPLSGQLPATVTVPRYLGSTDVTADTDFAITTGGGVTATINNSAGDAERGTISITGLTTLSASIYVATSYLGVPLYRQVQITRQDGSAPTGGGGSGGATDGPISTSDVTSPGTNTTHVQLVTPIAIKAGSSGTISGVAGITYHAPQSGTSSDGGLDAPISVMAIKWQYSADGSTGWTDLGAERGGDGASNWFSIQPPKGPHDEPGSVSLTQSKTGLTAGATAYLRLVGRCSAGPGISTVAGNVTVKQA